VTGEDGGSFFLTRKGAFAMDVLRLVINYLDASHNPARGRREAVEVLDWIAGEVVKGEKKDE